MSKDVTVDSSSASTQDLSDPAERFYAEPTKAESSPAQEEESSSVDTSKEVERTASDPEPEAQTEETEPQADTAPKPRTNAEKRIVELLAENKRLKQQAPKVEPKVEAPKVETKPAELKRPEPGQFETWEQFQTADREFLDKQVEAKVKDAVERDRQEQARKAAEEVQKTELAKAQKVMADRQKETEKRLPDLKAKLFDESGALRGDIQLHPVFDAFIPKSEVGWDILHHIATHPEDAAKIAAMDEFSAAGEFHRLQSDITAKIQNPPTKNLRPARTVAGSGITPKAKAVEDVLYGD